MKQLYQRIWDLALPLQDKRDDEGHARITLDYALMLLESEKGNEDIAVPAIMLHDIGWSTVPKERIYLLFDSETPKEAKLELRLEHQREGVRLAREILESVSYPSGYASEILEIISQHDTRKGFYSKEDCIVRDADKLWRFSSKGFKADYERIGKSFIWLYSRRQVQIYGEGFFCLDRSRGIALEGLNAVVDGYLQKRSEW